jgi:hypothetical protein
MTNTKPGSLTSTAVILPSAVIGGVGILVVGMYLAFSMGWPGWLAAAVLGLSAILAGGWLIRYRAAQRWLAALDAYGEREIAQARPRPARSIR